MVNGNHVRFELQKGSRDGDAVSHGWIRLGKKKTLHLNSKSVSVAECIAGTRIIHYSLLIVKFLGGGVQSCNYFLLIPYLLHLLIADLEVKHE